jgi:hypothetical protein
VQISLDKAEQRTVRDQPVWIVTGSITDDTGKTLPYLHQFPCDTLEWRAAEYAIDPTDVDTLLDIVMAEPFLTPGDWASGKHIYNHPDADLATVRADHIARCGAVAGRAKLVTRPDGKQPGKPHPLDPIRSAHAHWVDPDVVSLKAQLVNRNRQEQSSFQKAAAPTHDARERANAVLKALNAGHRVGKKERGTD